MFVLVDATREEKLCENSRLLTVAAKFKRTFGLGSKTLASIRLSDLRHPTVVFTLAGIILLPKPFSQVTKPEATI